MSAAISVGTVRALDCQWLEKTHQTDFQQSYGCHFSPRARDDVFVQLVWAERALAIDREGRSTGWPSAHARERGWPRAGIIGALPSEQRSSLAPPGLITPAPATRRLVPTMAVMFGRPGRLTMVVPRPQQLPLQVASLTMQSGPTMRAVPGTTTVGGMTTGHATASTARPVPRSSSTTD
jgi:hypothetical protein